MHYLGIGCNKVSLLPIIALGCWWTTPILPGDDGARWRRATRCAATFAYDVTAASMLDAGTLTTAAGFPPIGIAFVGHGRVHLRHLRRDGDRAGAVLIVHSLRPTWARCCSRSFHDPADAPPHELFGHRFTTVLPRHRELVRAATLDHLIVTPRRHFALTAGMGRSVKVLPGFELARDHGGPLSRGHRLPPTRPSTPGAAPGMEQMAWESVAARAWARHVSTRFADQVPAEQRRSSSPRASPEREALRLSRLLLAEEVRGAAAKV